MNSALALAHSPSPLYPSTCGNQLVHFSDTQLAFLASRPVATTMADDVVNHAQRQQARCKWWELPNVAARWILQYCLHQSRLGQFQQEGADCCNAVALLHRLVRWITTIIIVPRAFRLGDVQPNPRRTDRGEPQQPANSQAHHQGDGMQETMFTSNIFTGRGGQGVCQPWDSGLVKGHCLASCHLSCTIDGCDASEDLQHIQISIASIPRRVCQACCHCEGEDLQNCRHGLPVH